jgi:ribonuclease HII
MHSQICGLDEAGRGALAGPLVAAGVILRVPGKKISKASGIPLRDSKTLSKRQRERMYDALLQTHSTIAILQISAEMINKNGIGWANIEIFRMLVQQMNATEYIIDGNLKIGPILV